MVISKTYWNPFAGLQYKLKDELIDQACSGIFAKVNLSMCCK